MQLLGFGTRCWAVAFAGVLLTMVAACTTETESERSQERVTPVDEVPASPSEIQFESSADDADSGDSQTFGELEASPVGLDEAPTAVCNHASWATHDDYRCGPGNPSVQPVEYAPSCNDASWATHDDYRCGAPSSQANLVAGFNDGCNPAAYATYDDFRCGGTGDIEHTAGCNPATYATYDDFRCGGTGDIEHTAGCNPATYATYDDFRCGSTGDVGLTDNCNPAPYATYDDFRCGGN
jgi:hypothetical protein